MAISVYCEGFNHQCGYYLRIDQMFLNSSVIQSANASTTFQPIPPNPILINNFVSGNVEYGNITYHVLPFNKDSGSVVVLLNKTNIFGNQQNGDSKIIALI